MRNEKDLNVPNVHEHTVDARRRTNGNNKLQAVTHKPEPATVKADAWWRKYFHWENLTVAGREVKGFVVSPGIAAVLLASLLGMVGWAYKANTEDSRQTRDAIIRMETVLDERTRTFKEEQAKTDAKLDNEVKLGAMYREAQTKKDIELKWALRQKGIILDQ